MHIIEQLIAERAQKLMSRPRAWRAVRPLIYKTLGYKKAVTMADAVANLNGWDAFGHVSGLLKLQPQITGLENVPKAGPLMLISNHPTGLADGVFMYDALKTVRPDHTYMANADALRVVPNGADIIIPVEWVADKRTPAKARTTLKALKQTLSDNKAVVIFPSGVLAKMTWRGPADKVWNPTAVSVARKNGIPIIPVRIKSRNSALYYLLSVLNNELRDITLFRELLNKRGGKPVIIFGKPIDPAHLPKGSKAATANVRNIVERL